MILHPRIVGDEGRPQTGLFRYIDTIIFHVCENIILFTFVVKIMNVRNLQNYPYAKLIPSLVITIVRFPVF